MYVASMPLPWFLRRRLLNRFLGFRLDPTARIGFLTFALPRKELVMGPGCSLGWMTVIRGVERVVLTRRSHVGSLCWISAYPLQGGALGAFYGGDRHPELVLDEGAIITNRHLIDCSDRVTVGSFSILGGYRSTVMTHQIDLDAWEPACAPITIGDRCFIGTGVIVLPGAELPPFSVLSAGSVLAKGAAKQGMLYVGNPAEPVREVDRDGGYFSRTEEYFWGDRLLKRP